MALKPIGVVGVPNEWIDCWLLRVSQNQIKISKIQLVAYGLQAKRNLLRQRSTGLKTGGTLLPFANSTDLITGGQMGKRKKHDSNFFEIDYYLKEQWHIDEPTRKDGKEVDVWAMVSGKRISQKKFEDLHFGIQHKGKKLDFTLAAFNIPIVTKDIGDLIEEHYPNCIQRIPTTVGRVADCYEILVVTKTIECFDYDNSSWDPDDEDDPSCREVAGVVDLSILGDRVPKNVGLFHVKEWKVPIVIRTELKTLLENAGFTGLSFRPLIA